MFQLFTWKLDGTERREVTQAVQSLSWSGSWRDCARQLSAAVLPQTQAELGGAVQLVQDGEEVFAGHILTRQRDSLGQMMEVTALDNGHYLKRNTIYRAVRNQTPEAFVRDLCREFDIPTGPLAITGIPFSRNFLGNTLYQAILTGYTLASQQTGIHYQTRFRGTQFEIVEKKLSKESLRLLPGSNLLSCQSRDSIQEMVNSVGIYSDDLTKVATIQSEGNETALYGLMEKAIRASAYETPEQSARELLKENGISTTITAHCLGHLRLVTGNTVVVHEPVTGIDGLFWVQSDQHSWKNGLYQTKVTLEFRNLMDKQEAGSVPTE